MEMAQVSDSRSFTAETTTGTQLPTLPFDLLPEILCRLPVKLLAQLRCLCKLFNSLISDPKFAKKHLQLSTKRHHLISFSHNSLREWVRYDSLILSVFSTSTIVTQTQLHVPSTLTDGYYSVECSCDGVFCGELNNGSSYFLWNPFIRKFKLLPHLENPDEVCFSISFGYDHFIHNYKVIALSEKNEVCINTLGTDYWRRIDDDFPYSYHICEQGLFVSGTVNWFARDVVISLHLEKESYQQLFLPRFENENDFLTLSVLRDCLCDFATSDMFMDVWIMKEYGNKESWTKLYTVPSMPDTDSQACNALYISDNDQLLLEFYEKQSDKMKLVVYDSKTRTLNIPEFQNNYDYVCPYVYIESLILP